MKARSNGNHIQEAASVKNRVREWAEKIGVPVHQVHIREMRNKWASCSTSGRLTFGRDVLELTQLQIDYVIVHELLHLRVPNHGKLWKSLMRAYLGDYEQIEASLRAKNLS